MTNHNEHDPFLAPDWRHHRVASLVEQGRKPSRNDDAWTRRAYFHRRNLRHCKTDADHRRLAKKSPGLFHAHCLYEADPPIPRWCLESWLLTSAPPEQIAAKCGMTRDTVEAFQRIYFDVRERLAASFWVHNLVIRRKSHLDLADQDVDVHWKYVAYEGGPKLLGALFNPSADEGATQALEQFLVADARFTLTWKAFLAAHALPINEKTALKVLELQAHLLAIDQSNPGKKSSTIKFNFEMSELLAKKDESSQLAESETPDPVFPERQAAAPRPKRRVA